MYLSNTKKNFIYNVVYQLLIMTVPLISVPYVSRVMGAEAMGQYSYTYSIINYFMLISLLGITNYGNKRISYVRDNKVSLKINFWSIYSIQFIMTVSMMLVYTVYLILFCEKFVFIALVQFPFLISCAFDINWFFFGLENFKITVTRNIFIKIFGIILIFLLVKSPKDVWKYTLIMSLSMLISQGVLWIFLFKEIKFYKADFSEIRIHIKDCLVLFIPVIAYSIYKIMDKTMLGAMKHTIDLGYYEYAEKIYNIPLGIITALGTIMLPKISNMISKKQENEANKITYKSFEFVYFLSLPMMFGLMGTGSNIAILFLGKEYRRTGMLLTILSTCIIFVSIANIVRTQILIPHGKNKQYIMATCLGALLNFVININLIPKYGAIGACIGTVIAEFSVMLHQVVFIKKMFFVKKNIKAFIVFFIKAFIMFCIVYCIGLINVSLILKLFLQVFLGSMFYFSINYRYVLNLTGVRRTKYE